MTLLAVGISFGCGLALGWIVAYHRFTLKLCRALELSWGQLACLNRLEGSWIELDTFDAITRRAARAMGYTDSHRLIHTIMWPLK